MDNKAEEVYDKVIDGLFEYVDSLGNIDEQFDFMLITCGSIVQAFTEAFIDEDKQHKFIDEFLGAVNQGAKHIIDHTNDGGENAN